MHKLALTSILVFLRRRERRIEKLRQYANGGTVEKNPPSVITRLCFQHGINHEILMISIFGDMRMRMPKPPPSNITTYVS